jgi:hypothetical protein
MKLAGLDPEKVASPAIAVALDAIYAQPSPTRAQLDLWKRITPRALLAFAPTWPSRRARRVAAAIGRRGLKTSGLVTWALLYELLCGGHEAHAVRGSRVYYLVIAPYIAQAREATRAIRAGAEMLAGLGVHVEVRDAQGSPEIIVTLDGDESGVERVIAVMPADSVTVRGFAVAFVAYDEAGFFPSADWHSMTLKDIDRAVAPGMAQFKDPMRLFVSSPGAPQGLFHALVTKPPKDVLVLRAPTWVTNPRITRAKCEELAGEDSVAFTQEYEASRFGYSGETFIDSASLKLGSEHADLGPRPGFFAVAVDIGQLVDSTALVVASSFVVEVRPDAAPVRHLVCEHAESIAASRKDPIPIELVAMKAAGLSRMYGDAPILFDVFAAPSMKRELEKLGYTEHAGNGPPAPRTFSQRSMAPQHQTPRWVGLRQLAQGGRLHLGEGHEELARQLAQLRATTMSGGSLKVEGRRDDLADALALAGEVALQLPPTGGPDGTPHCETSIRWHGHAGLEVINRWTKNGAACPPPEWHPSFDEHAMQMLSRGIHTPAIDRWLVRQSPDLQRAYGISALEPVRVTPMGDPHARSERINARVKF